MTGGTRRYSGLRRRLKEGRNGSVSMTDLNEALDKAEPGHTELFPAAAVPLLRAVTGKDPAVR